MEEYIDQVGSLDADKLEDKSLKDVKRYLRDEIDSHEQTLAEKENDVRFLY